MDDFKAIRCAGCGGAMYSDQKTAGYRCPYCGASVPWSEENYYRPLPVSFTHKPVPVVDGLLKLGHVDIMTSVERHDQGPLSRLCRLCSVEETLARWDTATAAAFAGSVQVSFRCPSCGAEVTGSSTQSIFECAYCGGKTGAREALKPGAYKREYIMGVGAENVPGRAIPFSVSPPEAKNAARALVRAWPGDFAGQDMEQRIDRTMEAVYIPFGVADLSLKLEVGSNRGEFTCYQEIIDWPYPDTTLYDIHLLDRLDPWDFGGAAPFDPAFAEGEFRIASVANNTSTTELVDNLLAERAESDLRDAFGLRRAELLRWGRDLRKQRHGPFLLPVYYLDRRPGDGSGLQVRIAVNGQTGRAAALFLRGEKTEYFRVSAPCARPMSAESTIRMAPVPVRKVRKPFLHEVLPFEKAVRRRGLAALLPR